MRTQMINKLKTRNRRVTICFVLGLVVSISLAYALTAYAAGFSFFSKQKDLPSGAYWYVTNDHDSEARDLVVRRWTGSSWTGLKEGITEADFKNDPKNESTLSFGTPVYAVSDGEVMTCWRNAPENPYSGAVRAERDGCDGKCDQFRNCSCTIPRAGNHVNVRMANGQVILYAHLKSGSIPAAVCPKEGSTVANALDSNKSGPNGFLPEIWIPDGERPKIKAGQFLGLVGNNGASSGPHLHIHQSKCDTHDCGSVPLLFTGISASVGVDWTKGPSEQKWKILTPGAPLSGPPQLIRLGQVISK